MPTLSGAGKPLGMAVIPGGAAATDLGPVSGIDPADTLVDVKHITADLVTNTSVLSEASITGADTVQLTTTNTTGDFLVVVWMENE